MNKRHLTPDAAFLLATSEISRLKDTLTWIDTIKLKIAVLKAATLQARMNDLM